MKKASKHTKPQRKAETANQREIGDMRENQPMMDALYGRAEAELILRHRTQHSGAGGRKTGADTLRALHELEVHQIELEMQNAELQKARDEIELALENYTDLYDFAPVGYFTLNAAGSIQMVNLNGASLVGIERSRLTGRSFGMLVSSGFRPGFNTFLKEIFANQARQSDEFELLSQGQPPRTVKIEAQCLPSGHECRAAVFDITERKQAEDRVRVSEVRYRRLFESAHDGVILIDPGTRKITDTNPFMTKLLGYPQDQLVGKELFEIGLLKDEAASREMFLELKKRREARYENLPLRSKSGRHKDVEVVANLHMESGQPVIQCNIRDITVRKQAEKVQRRADVLTASNRKLRLEIVRRKAVESSLKKSEQNKMRLLERSRSLQEELRHLSRQVLRVQEEERKRISRELHDVISQTLTGITINLATLKKQPGLNKGYAADITRTQRLVEKSVGIVHDFARKLRPTVMDDLGLIPALHAFMKDFTARTGVRTCLTAFAGVEQLDEDWRTALFRVAQEALANVARHAQASLVKVIIQKMQDGTCMKITDDGKSFNVEHTTHGKGGKRLGLLGMRERMEMVGGNFTVTSAPGKGTTVCACVPFAQDKGKKKTTPEEKTKTP